MAGVGNYIHYHRSQYVLHGINRNGAGNTYGWDYGVAKDHLNDLLKSANTLSKEQAKELEKYYTALFYGDLDKKVTLLDKTNNREIEMSMEKLIQRVLNDYKSGKRNFDLADKDLDLIELSLQKATNTLISELGKINRPGKSGKTSLNMIKRYIDALNAACNPEKAREAFRRGIMDGKTGYNSVEELRNKAIELHRAIESIYIENGNAPSRKMVSSTQENELSKALNEAYSLLEWYKGSFAGRLAGDASEIISVLDALTNAEGTLVGVNAFGDVLSYFANFENTWAGRQKVTQEFIGFDLNFDDPNGFKMFGEKLKSRSGNFGQWTYDTGAGKIVFTPSSTSSGGEGTVDISLHPIEGTELAKIVGLDQLNISLKNYSSLYADNKRYSGISILSSTPLLSILMNCLTTDFVNHYLNLLGAHPFLDTNNYQEATRLVQYAAVVRGLIGSSHNNNVLIANIRNEKRVCVIPVGDLADIIGKNLKNINEYVRTINLPPKSKIESYIETSKKGEGAKFYYNNWIKWENSTAANPAAATERIVNYLMGIHGIKITASLLPAVFNK